MRNSRAKYVVLRDACNTLPNAILCAKSAFTHVQNVRESGVRGCLQMLALKHAAVNVCANAHDDGDQRVGRRVYHTQRFANRGRELRAMTRPPGSEKADV